MRPFPLFVLVALGIAATPLAAFGADVVQSEGATFSLDAAPPDESGHLRAALRIELDPGWKTYWLDPGEAGIPPSVDFSGSEGLVDLKARFPAPHRFDDGEGISSIGYSKSFSVAIEGNAAPSSARRSLDIRLAVGLCRELCVPATVELRLDPTDGGNGEAVAAAFEALPRTSGPTEGITGLHLASDGKTLAVSISPAALADGADIFVAAPDWVFGKPIHADRRGEEAELALPVLRKPRKAARPTDVEAILAGQGGTFGANATIGGAGG